VFGGDFNISKSHTNVNTTLVDNFCHSDGIMWLDLNDCDISYTYHADTNGIILTLIIC